jgi:hypothetical protein
MSKTTQTPEQKKSAKAAYDKARRTAKKASTADTTKEKAYARQSKAEAAADRAALEAEAAADRAALEAEKSERPMVAGRDRADKIAERAKLKATAGKNGKPAAVAVPDLSKAEHVSQELLAKVTKTPAGKALVKEQKKATKATKEPKERQPTVASVARELIANGETDEAVFAQLVEQFKVTDAKKTYPSWYRSQLVRKGVITKVFADAHRHGLTA